MYQFEDWVFYGYGAYNYVYRSKDGTRILKIMIPPSEITDLPERSVRVWRELNPDLPASIIEITDQMGCTHQAWTCPFVKGRPSTDDEIFNHVVKIYNSTGRIIVDGYNANNFITTPSGEVICIDVGCALELNTRHERRRSETSLLAWSRLEPLFRRSFELYGELLPRSTLLVKSLLFIKQHRPDIRDVSFFLSPNEDLWTKLKLATRKSPSPFELHITQALEALDIAAASLLVVRPLEIGGSGAAGGAEAAAGGAGAAAGGAGATVGVAEATAGGAEGLRHHSIFADREGKEPEIYKLLGLGSSL